MTGMTSMEDPTKGLGQIIAGVDRPSNMFHDEISLFAPFLDSEMLDLDVSCSRSRPVLIDHIQCGQIVDQQARRARSKSAEFLQHITKVFGYLSSGNCRVKLSLGGTGGNNWLDTTLPCNSSTAEEDDITSYRTSGE
jgi:hypothetical protein